MAEAAGTAFLGYSVMAKSIRRDLYQTVRCCNAARDYSLAICRRFIQSEATIGRINGVSILF